MQLLEGEIKMLCVKARDIFMQQPILLELEAPIKICGELLYWATVRKHTALSTRVPQEGAYPRRVLETAPRVPTV